MNVETLPRLRDALHVTNGESTGNTLRRTGLGGAVLTWDDVLYEGPVPAVPGERLRELRARFLSECGWGDARSIEHSLERRDRHLEQALHAGRDVVLWFEHDLYDQLQLLQILAQAAATAGVSRPELIVVGSFEGHPGFHGLGELTADELESLWPRRRLAGDDALDVAVRAWDALRAPEPMRIEALLAEDLSALPFLASALARLLEELPDTETGLSRSERQLLEELAHGPRTPVQLFLHSQQREQAPYDGDAWVWRRLAALGEGERSLVAFARGGPLPAPPPRGDARTFADAEVALTDSGRDVLAGAADRVELLGIDRWLGGTHLHAGNVPRWDAAAGRVV
jgi:hypothetical protein